MGIIANHTLYIRNEDGTYQEIPAIKGKSAYEIAVDNGFKGTIEEWLTSLDGDYKQEIVIQDTEPTESSVKMWVDSSSGDSDATIPYVEDTIISDEDTWSSKKINEAISKEGGKWFFGTAITGGSSVLDASFATGIENALDGYCYLNTSTLDVYQCITAGTEETARWKYCINIASPIINIISTEGYMKAESVEAMPKNPDANTIYFIQGEVTVV